MIRDIVIPLYLRRSAKNASRIGLSFQDAPAPGFVPETSYCVPVHRDADAGVKADVEASGHISIWLMETESHAVTAQDALARIASEDLELQAGSTFDGEGLLMIVDPMKAPGIDFQDRRLAMPRMDDRERIVPFWDSTATDIAGIPEREPRGARIGMAVHQILARTGNIDAVQSAQSNLEYIPGAYVGFTSRCIEDFSRSENIEIPDEKADSVHTSLLSAAQKMDNPMIFEAVDDEIRFRIKSKFPEIYEDADDPAPQFQIVSP